VVRSRASDLPACVLHWGHRISRLRCRRGMGQLRDAHHERRRASVDGARMHKPDPTLPPDQQDKRSMILLAADSVRHAV